MMHEKSGFTRAGLYLRKGNESGIKRYSLVFRIDGGSLTCRGYTCKKAAVT